LRPCFLNFVTRLKYGIIMRKLLKVLRQGFSQN
jgi:hypothetical protein